MSASRMLFVFIIFAMVVGGMLLVVGNMSAKPLGTGTYGTYTNYTDSSAVNLSVQAVTTVATVEVGTGKGIMIMIAAIVVVLTLVMLAALFKGRRGRK